MTTLPSIANELIEARCDDPFAYLGVHPAASSGVMLRAFKPNAEHVWLLPKGQKAIAMPRIEGSDLFELHRPEASIDDAYRFRIEDKSGNLWEEEDCYRFSPFLGDLDLHLMGEGTHYEKYKLLGAHVRKHEAVAGVSFAVWAPNAKRVSVVGNFNHWDGRIHMMRRRGASGIWELFIPGLSAGEVYKFELLSAYDEVLLKADPYAQQMELRPATASVVHNGNDYAWDDGDWMATRASHQHLDQPMSIYEVHLGSWRRENDTYVNYRDLAHQLVAYCKDLGFTHIELLPIMEHPFDGSWGYQTVGYFAPTSRFGTPDDFRYFVDYCHQHGIGVMLDWVPAHFPKDAHGLARFDGTALYEHSDPRQGEHRDWGTLIFNYGRNEVRNFLIANALFWLDHYHLDGLRVDAVASMLYLDYSRENGEWIPNKFGGRENLDAVDFLRTFNCLVHERFPGAVTMAEESTSWPMVSKPTYLGGLGFTMKWNMGWMNDTLDYFSFDPVYRCFHHNNITFSMMYAYTENFVSPFSHDEVVHGKGSMPLKMPGDDWQKFANLRAMYSYMFTHPGKKLLFMGCEFGQWQEWNCDSSLQWDQIHNPLQAGLLNLVRDLNHLYTSLPSLHAQDHEHGGFEWLDCSDAMQSTLSYIRRDEHGHDVVVILNLTPVPRHHYRLGVPCPGYYEEVLNSDADVYGGSGMGNYGGVHSENKAWMGHYHSLDLTLPPLSAMVFKHTQGGCTS